MPENSKNKTSQIDKSEINDKKTSDASAQKDSLTRNYASTQNDSLVRNYTSVQEDMLVLYEHLRTMIQDKLEGYFKDDVRYKTLLEAMRYSLLSGGKRIRAVLCIGFCLAAGGAVENALKAACAIEMLHAYSLIHDDLPCMDDSDERRGLPSNHIKYGEANAVLAGDALQTAAFETLLTANLSEITINGMIKILAKAASAHGICGGQFLDLSVEGKQITAAQLEEIHNLKTTALFIASAKLGVIAAAGSMERLKAAEEYAASIGLAFQVRDDMLDTTATSDKLGKPTDADSRNAKVTFASYFSADECERVIKSETEKAVAAVAGRFQDTAFLTWFAGMLAERTK